MALEPDADGTTATRTPPPASGSRSAPRAPLCGAVAAFANARGIAPQVETTARLLLEAFPAGSELALQLEPDPEADGCRLNLDVCARGTPADALAAYSAFVARWVATVPVAARDSMCVTFTVA